jgi:uncharacterized membrane protein
MTDILTITTILKLVGLAIMFVGIILIEATRHQRITKFLAIQSERKQIRLIVALLIIGGASYILGDFIRLITE